MGIWKTYCFGENGTSGDTIGTRLNAMRHLWLGIENLKDEQGCENLRGFTMSEIQLSFWLERKCAMLLNVATLFDLRFAQYAVKKSFFMFTMMTIQNHWMFVGYV
jgi:hypothetical protein